MPKSLLTLTSIASCVLAAGLSLAANQAKAEGFYQTEGNHGSFTPWLFGAAVSGDAQIGPLEREIEVSTSDLLSALTFGAFLTGEYWFDRWGVMGSLSFTDFADDKKVGPLDVDMKLRYVIADLAVSYRFGPFGESSQETVIDPYIGLRHTNVELELGSAIGDSEVDKQYWDPIIGARLTSRLSDRSHFVLAGDVAFGNEDTNSSQFYALYLHERKNGHAYGIGYRIINQEFKTSDPVDTYLDVQQHGPVFSYTIPF